MKKAKAKSNGLERRLPEEQKSKSKSLLEIVRESAEDMWNTSTCDESEEREFDFVDGILDLIEGLLFDLLHHDMEMAELEEPRRPKGMPHRLSNRADAIKRLQDALEDWSNE